jgi:isopentenyl diphosphate isomerase/L-lactate dehydrogenase-like FMN-dependent dehydrogenase
MSENSAINRRSFVSSVAAAGVAGGVVAAAAPARANDAVVAQAVVPDAAAPPARPKQQQFLTTMEIIALAKKTMTPDLWRFVSGGSESETTLLRNRLGLDSLAFMPNVFEDVSSIDTSTMYLGRKLRIPVVIAPIGSVQAIHPDGVMGTATAAKQFGTVVYGSYPLSTPAFEEVIATTGAPLVVNLYLFGDRAWLKDTIDRAQHAGATALGVTADSAVYGRREGDIANRFAPRSANAVRMPFSVEQSDRNRSTTTWETIKFIRSEWRGPLIIKGIINPAMAKRAVDMGANVIHVSNHGGRQMDCLPGTIEMLPDIVAAVNGHADVIVDGGFVRGTDVVKALALGAKAVGIGKLQAWALAAAGPPGLVRMLEILETEIHTCMALCGVSSVAKITRDLVRPAHPVREPGLLSAFPYFPAG